MKSDEKMSVNPYKLYYLVKIGVQSYYYDLIEFFKERMAYKCRMFKKKYPYLQDSDFESCINIGVMDSITDFQPINGNDYYSFAKMCIERRIYSLVRTERAEHLVLKGAVDEETGAYVSDGAWLESLDDDVAGSENLKKIDMVSSKTDVEKEVMLKIKTDEILEKLQNFKGEKYRKVAEMRIEGYTFEEIAKNLNLTNKQVEYAKLQIRNFLASEKNDLI